MRRPCRDADLTVDGIAGSTTGEGASITDASRAAELRAPSSACAATGRGATSSNAARGISDDREHHALESSVVHRSDAEHERDPGRHPDAERGESGADTRGACRRGGGTGELAVVAHHALDLCVGRTERDEVGSALEEIDHGSGGHAAPSGSLLRLGLAGEHSREPGDDGRGYQQCRRDGDRGARKEQPQRDGGRQADDTRDPPRRQHAEPDVLQRVDVSDDSSEQVAAVEAVQPGRCESLEPLVDADSQLGQRPEHAVVPDETLAVAEQATGDGEEPNADDREPEVRDRAVLRAPRDQPRRRAEERDR